MEYAYKIKDEMCEITKFNGIVDALNYMGNVMETAIFLVAGE
jgi:hypothetical protein